ncbi:MAG: ABC transporter ATP-binding protein [Spirochaetales bacterium]|nr:ABC transporter ATP-binding protein [Spirochaetales bacterium]
MSDFFEHEEILKSYDARIMRRILGYLKPYLLFFILAVAALLIATVGELLLPIIIQRAVDNQILPYRRGIVLSGLEPGQIDRMGDIDREYLVDGVLYIPASRLADFSAREKELMRENGVLLEENFLAFPTSGTGVSEAVADYPDLITAGAKVVIVTQDDLKRMDRDAVRALRKNNYEGLAGYVRTLVAVLFGVFVFTFLQVYLEAYVSQMVMKDLRSRLFEHTLGLSLRYLDRNPVGRLVSRVTNDVETINEMFTEVLTAVMKDFSTMIGVTVALFLLSPRLALVTIATLPPVFIVTVLFRVKVRDAFRAVRLAISRLNAFLSEHISGMRIVQLFVQEKRVAGEFDEKNGEVLEASLLEMRLFATFRPLMDLLSTTSTAVVIYFGAYFLLRDLVSLGVLIAFLNLIRMFYQPVMDLSEKYNILQSAMAGAERMFNLLDADDRVSEPLTPIVPQKTVGRIEFDRVNFSYKPGEPVLRDLSFTIEPGATVAIVGYTGAGKTTITSVLTRLWDIESGVIRLDGTDIRDIPTKELRRRVQSVLQDVFLFSGTILDNIRLGDEIPVERVRRAVEQVQADSFINRLPKGLETELTERAGNLSTGQRQLLSFARALAHNPDVLILDEATGNIDTETEKLIQSALVKLLADRTSIVIAHRLSTIRNADRIIVLHNGRVFEAGTHDELMTKKGMYHTLYQMQFLSEERT